MFEALEEEDPDHFAVRQVPAVTKRDKTTEIYFDEASPVIEIQTHNTDLKNRLTAYARRYPDLCKQTDEDEEQGYMRFEIVKARFSFRLTAPYSEERRRAASEAAKKTSFPY